MCHLVLYFPKIYHSGEEGALITFVYIQIRHPSHSSPSVKVIVVGGEQNRPAPKDNPCSIFLSFFRGGGRAGGAFFFRKLPLPI